MEGENAEQPTSMDSVSGGCPVLVPALAFPTRGYLGFPRTHGVTPLVNLEGNRSQLKTQSLCSAYLLLGPLT